MEAVRWGILSTALNNHAVLDPARETDKADVVAVASRDQARADDYAQARDRACLAELDCSFELEYGAGLEALGSKGSAQVQEPWHCRDPAIVLRRGGKVERIEVEDVDRYLLQLENFSEAIRGEAEPLLGREDALGQARTIDALYRSAESAKAEPS